MSDHNVCRAFCLSPERLVLLDRTGTRRRPSSRRSLRMAPRCVSSISKATTLKPRSQSHRRRWRRTVRRVLLQKTSSLKSISASSKRSHFINCSNCLKFLLKPVNVQLERQLENVESEKAGLSTNVREVQDHLDSSRKELAAQKVTPPF